LPELKLMMMMIIS